MRSRALVAVIGFVAITLLAVAAGPAQGGSRSRAESILGLASLRQAICRLYVETGLTASQPRFCPPAAPVLTCDKPLDPGPCRAQIPRWGFDASKGACVTFQWGGCAGNENRFETREDCEASCQPRSCEQHIDPGPCDAAFPRWGFDAERGECVSFTWGGCESNGNNFESRENCDEACGSEVDVCGLPAVVGPCDAAIPRWYHDAQSGHCERFIYGGCGGNANNFETLAECEGACLDRPRCELPADPGPCRAAIPRWFHDAETGHCERFIYGGCAGNANNFETLAACERACTDCDDSLCAEHQVCQLFRDPACRAKHERCERLCGDGCDEPCDPVPFCADRCEGFPCEPGKHCELIPVSCIRPPCPPVARCVGDRPDLCADHACGPFQECKVYAPTGESFCADTCAEGACPDGTNCTLVEVQCVRAPCPPVRHCGTQ